MQAMRFDFISVCCVAAGLFCGAATSLQLTQCGATLVTDICSVLSVTTEWTDPMLTGKGVLRTQDCVGVCLNLGYVEIIHNV